MKFKFLPLAVEDLFDAIDYYESQQEGLGSYFSNEVFKAVDRIVEHPDSWTRISEACRRCIVNKFPYELIYRAEYEHIVVVAVASQHRHPDFWTHR